MEGFVKVAKLAEIPEDRPYFVECEDTPLALVKLQGRVYAVHDECPHRAGPLSEGEIEDGKIRCPWHGALIDPETGAASGPATRPAVCFSARVVDGDVEVMLQGQV